MTLPITIPSPSSPSSDESSSLPRTPVSPTIPTPNTVNSSSSASGKRKSSRRANTAERRATHNAVERARRETLNGRFLDLAKMLPNLSQIRRPSKSAIVNSSIAHVHASRRHRALAARELRMLKLETDHIRRELNEWRDRAGIPRVEEPIRGEGFSMVLNQELEVIPVLTSNGDDEDDGLYGDEVVGDIVGDDAGPPIGLEGQQRMRMPGNNVGGRVTPPTMTINTNFNYQRPAFHHQPRSHPVMPSGSFDGYNAFNSYSATPNEKYSHSAIPQYFDGLAIRGTPRPQSGRDRSNSMASMTSNGSASPPLYAHPPQYEEGWTQMDMGHPMGRGGMNHGVNYPMM